MTDALRKLMTHDDQLDDITRARIWSGLEDKLATHAAPRRRWPIVLAFGTTLAAAAAIVIALFARTPTRPDPDHVMTVPADVRVAYQIGPHARSVLVGPAQLDVLGSAGDATSVHLHRGTLLADFTGGRGRSLRIITKSAVIDIVGTVFAVDVRGDVTCTSVSHGRVRVTTARTVVYVDGGQRYCTNATSVHPIAPDVRDALERHESSITATVMPTPAPTLPPRATQDDSGEASTDTSLNSAPVRTSDNGSAASADAPRAATSGKSKGAVSSAASGAPSTRAATSAAPSTRAATSPAATSGASKGVSSAPRATTSPAASRAPSAPPPATASPSNAAPSHAAPSHAAPSRAPASPATSSHAAPSHAAPSRTPASPATPSHAAPSHAGTSRAPVSPAAASPAPPTPPAPSAASPAAPPPPTPPSADELYRLAEAALAKRDLSTADRHLASLVANHRSSPLRDQALYERARIAHQQRRWSAARTHLDALAAIDGTPLGEPGHYLRCRVAAESRDNGAAACFAGYRKRFPRSAHDVEALGFLAQHAHASGGCAAATKFIDELVRNYPRAAIAVTWQKRCAGENE